MESIGFHDSKSIIFQKKSDDFSNDINETQRVSNIIENDEYHFSNDIDKSSLEDFNSIQSSLNFRNDYTGLQNVLNFLGWIPFLGTTVGIIRFSCTILLYLDDEYKEEHKKFYISSFLRAGVEFFSLGWIYIIPDIYITLKRRRKNKKKLKS